MQPNIKKPHNKSDNSIHNAVVFLIEECIRNNEHKKAKILTNALIKMENPHIILDKDDYDNTIDFLSRIIRLDNETLQDFIKVIEQSETIN